MKSHNINIPESATKQLAIQACSAGRKLTVSTNWLPLFGFTQDVEVVEELIGEGRGIVVRLAGAGDIKKKKVYTRTYTARRNNPLETQLDIRSQSLLDRAIPADTKNVHITFSHGKVTIRPITSRQAKRIHLAKSASSLLSAFVACSSGVDATSLYNEGFRIDAALEWRPNEKRDKDRDLSETGALNFISNAPVVKRLINEDIGEVDVNAVAHLVSASKTALLSISLQCDEFSNVKAKSLKERSLEDLSTSSDMVYDALKIIEASNFPFILLEQVPGFMSSEAYAIMETKLRKWNYYTHKIIADSRYHGGFTSRKRFYMFATSFDVPFAWPEQSERRLTPIWDEFIAPALPRLRDVTHSKSIQDGAACGRLRVINQESTCSPTFLKSQDRMAKDSVVVEYEGRYYFPDNELMQVLMGFPVSFSTDAVSLSQASEIIGQSVDYGMHHQIVQSVKRHVELVDASLSGRKQLSLMLAS